MLSAHSQREGGGRKERNEKGKEKKETKYRSS